MKVGIVVGGRFVAFDIARELQRRGRLAGIVSAYVRAPLEGIQARLLTWNPIWDVRQRFARARGRIPGPEIDYEGACQFGRWAARRLPAADVLQLWSGYALESVPAARAAGATVVLLRGSAHIETQAELVREEFDRFGLRTPAVSRRMVQRELAEYAAADYINVISTFAHRTFRERGVPPERLVLTPLGVEAAEVAPPGAGRRAAPAGAPLRVLFLGVVSLRKGVHYLLEAARRLGRGTVEVSLIGGASADGQEVLRRLARPGEWQGPVARSALAGVFARHDVLVLPSVEDGFGAVICEAMAAGLPVIASANSGGPDVIAEGGTGFVVPARSADALADALATLAADRKRCRAMGEAAAAAMRAGRGWPGFVDSMLAQYEDARARQGGVACAS